MRSYILVLLALLVGPACNRGGGGKPQVAYVTNGSANFWVIAKAGALAGASEHGVDVDVRFPQDISDQKRIVEDLLTRGIEGIAISPIDPDNQVELLNQAAAQTHLITHDSDAPASRRRCYVGMDNYQAGLMCGELVKEALPDGGEIVIFVGRLEQDNARRRRQGVIDAVLGREPDPSRYDAPGQPLSGGGYTILDTLTDQFDRLKGKSNVEDSLSRHPGLDCMVGLFEYNPPLCLEVLRQAGKLGQVKVVAFDEAQETLQAIRDGHAVGTIVQDPYRYGKESVRILAALARGDESVLPAGGFLDIPARRIGPAEVDAFQAELERNLAAGS